MARKLDQYFFGTLMSFFIYSLPSCALGYGHRCIKLDSNFLCIDRPDDTTGYLKPICEYIVRNFDCYPQDPNTLEIITIISGAEQKFFGLPQYSTVEYDFVELSCCHTGDWVVIHVESRTVVEFIPGDY